MYGGMNMIASTCIANTCERSSGVVSIRRWNNNTSEETCLHYHPCADLPWKSRLQEGTRLWFLARLEATRHRDENVLSHLSSPPFVIISSGVQTLQKTEPTLPLSRVTLED